MKKFVNTPDTVLAESLDGFAAAGFLDALQEGQPVHARHVDVAQDHVDALVRLQRLERLYAILREDEAQLPLADLPAELLDDQRLQIRFVVDDKDRGSQAARPISARRSVISMRNSPKSSGFVRKARAPRSSALARVAASP